MLNLWEEEQKQAMKKLKEAVTRSPVLKAPEYNDAKRPFFLRTDASDKGVGSVLEQCDIEGNRRPC